MWEESVVTYYRMLRIIKKKEFLKAEGPLEERNYDN
jgi:hypothetical protein